jgi:RNA polymerase sigma factor (sigma-70 family)
MPDMYMVVSENQHSATVSTNLERRARFNDLYAYCHPAVLGYVLRRCVSPEDAADAIAETFLIAWRRLDEIPAGEDRRLWLYGVARRVLANQRRGDRRRFALTQRLTAELAETPGPPEPSGALAELAAAFKHLSETDREILALEGWEGLDAGQVAAVLGCSRNAARIRLHRARRRLEQQLRQQHADTTTPDTRIQAGEAT